MSTFKALTFSFIAIVSSPSYAELGQPDGLPVRLGASIETVQKTLGTALEPDKDEQLPPFTSAPSSSITLKTRGIRVFFNSFKVVRTVRLDAPFAGRILGIKIGDTPDDVVAKLGPPPKKQMSGTKLTNYYYYPDDITTVNFYFPEGQQLDSIYVFK